MVRVAIKSAPAAGISPWSSRYPFVAHRCWPPMAALKADRLHEDRRCRTPGIDRSPSPPLFDAALVSFKLERSVEPIRLANG